MSSGSDKWESYNASKGYDGRSKWTQKDWKEFYGDTSPAKSRRSSIPKRGKVYNDVVPF